MLKRIFSKRSGFTLVEILVAFAIFTIMMSMIMQILQLSVEARRQNTEMSREHAAQEEQLLFGKDLLYDKSAAETGKVKLNFGADQNYELDYQIRGTDDDNPADGLNYFVGNVDYNAAVADGDKQKKDSKSGSQMSQYDTRITGTANLGEIEIGVEKNGTNRYIFTLTATSADVSEEMKKYSQIRLYFFNDNKIYSDVNEYADGYVTKKSGPTEDDIKTYKKCSVYANIKEVGFTDGGSITKRISKNDPKQEILLQGLGNSIRISYYGGSCFTGDSIKFFVEFDDSIDINAMSFGSNGEGDNKKAVYKKYTTKDSEGNEIEESNIYGGKNFEVSKKPFSGSIWVAGEDDWEKNPSKNVRWIDTTTPDPTPGEGDEKPVTPTPNPSEGGESTPDTPVEGGGE